MASPARTIALGGRPLVTLLGMSGPARRFIEQEYRHVLVDGDDGEVQVCFEPPPERPGRRRFSTRGFHLGMDRDGTLLLCDHRGRAGELPVTGTERFLRVDPELDNRFARALHQYVNRLVDWRAAEAGMVIFKGAAFTVAGRTIGFSGYGGSGKSSALFESLGQAEAYLANDYLWLMGPATLAGYQTPVQLVPGRTYSLAAELYRNLPWQDRARLTTAGRLVRRLPSGVRSAVMGRLGGRPVAVDPTRLSPRMRTPETAVLNDLVCLSRHDGDDVIARSIDHQELTSAVSAQVNYYNATQLELIRVFHGYAAPKAPSWPVMPLERQLSRVSSLLAGVQGWELQVPETTPAAEVRRIVHRLLLELDP